MFGELNHKRLYYIGVGLLGFGMMLGTVPTSVPQFILLGNWLLEGRFKEKWASIRSNKIFWILASVFLMHLLGMIHTQYFSAGADDIRIKIPLLLLPLIFFTSPAITLKELKWILLAFIVGCVCNVGWCLFYAYTKLGHQSFRQASRFMSHIRLSLLLNVALLSCYWCFNAFKHNKYKWLFVLAAVFLILSMIKLALVTGLVILIFTLLVMLMHFTWKKGIKWRIISIGLVLGGCLMTQLYVKKNYDKQFTIISSPVNQFMLKSPSGRFYEHSPGFTLRENGYYIYRNIQFNEIERAWNKRCPEDSFLFYPKFVNVQRGTVLLRYLSSMGLAKDSVSVTQLRIKDIRRIKEGITNCHYPEWNSLQKRLYELFFEYQSYLNNADVSGHSLSMRFYFWQAAIHILSKHVWLGVGTGDAKRAFRNAYFELNTPLKKEWRLRSHNQFLAIGVSFGVIGIIAFLIFLFFPGWILRRHLPFLYLPFFIIAILSFLVEDTLESQTGLTFFAYFNTLLLAVAYFQKKEELKE
jgi:hypothetical protein